MAAFVGRKFRVSTTRSRGEEFDGILHSLDTFNKKITLTKVYLVSTGKHLPGLQHFYGQEILNLVEITDEVDSKGNRASKDANKSQDAESETEEDFLDSDTSRGYIYIHRIGAKFRQAVAHIKSQHLINVAVESERLGRTAKVSLLEVSCLGHVFIFDVLSLGAALFSEGLADILESPTIVKVMHDSRWASDQLFHRYSLKLTNVYDTQAADFLVRMRGLNGEVPPKLRSLSECLMEYLDLSLEEVYPQWLHDKAEESESSTSWIKRPLQASLLSRAAGRVRYLSDLRIVTLHHLLAEFTASVDVFLSCVRDMSDVSRCKAKVGPSMVPRQLEKLVFGPLPSTSVPPISNHCTSAIGCNPQLTESVLQPKSEKEETSCIPESPPSTASIPTNGKDRYQTASFHSADRLSNGRESAASGDKACPNLGHDTAGNNRPASDAYPRPNGGSDRRTRGSARVARDDGVIAPAAEEESGRGAGDNGEAEPGDKDSLASAPSAGGGALGQGTGTGCGNTSMEQKSTMGTKINGNKAGGVEDESHDKNDGDEVDKQEEEEDEEEEDEEDEEEEEDVYDTSTEDSKSTEGYLSFSSEQPTSNESTLEQAYSRLHSSISQSPTAQLPSDTYQTSPGLVSSINRSSGNPYGHNPHGHNPHGHNPHSHNPQGHNPHGHIPHGHIPHGHNPHSHNPFGQGYSGALTPNRSGLNVHSTADFPELSHEMQRKHPKKHPGHGRPAPVSDSPSSSSPAYHVNVTDVMTKGSGLGTYYKDRESAELRPQGAVRKRLSSFGQPSEDTGCQSPSGAQDAGSHQRSPQQRASPAVGRGRARMLACHEDILRNIRRPIDLEMQNKRIQRFDFPSQEEIDKVPKPKPLRASFYYTEPKDSDSG